MLQSVGKHKGIFGRLAELPWPSTAWNGKCDNETGSREGKVGAAPPPSQPCSNAAMTSVATRVCILFESSKNAKCPKFPIHWHRPQIVLPKTYSQIPPSKSTSCPNNGSTMIARIQVAVNYQRFWPLFNFFSYGNCYINHASLMHIRFSERNTSAGDCRTLALTMLCRHAWKDSSGCVPELLPR